MQDVVSPRSHKTKASNKEGGEVIKLTRYRDPWSDDPEMKCFAEKYPYGEVEYPQIEQKEEGYFFTEQEMRGLYKTGHKNGYDIGSGKRSFDVDTFDQWLAKQLRESALSELVAEGEKNGEYEIKEATDEQA